MNNKLSIRAFSNWSLVVGALLLLPACSSDSGGSSSSGSQLSPPSVSVNFIDVNTLEVTWSQVSGASEYHVYRSDDADGTRARFDIVSTTSTNATDLEPSTEYWFWVTACSSSVNCSGFSTAVTGDTTPSDIAPTDFSATGGVNSITLTWTAVDGYTYNLLRATSNCLPTLEADDFANYATLCLGFEPNLVNGVNSGEVQSDLSVDMTYHFWLETVDTYGTREYSYVSAAPISPADVEPGELLFSKFFSSGIGDDMAVAIDEDNSIVYVASGNQLYALDADEGYEKWSSPFTADGTISSSPLIDSGGGVYIAATTVSGNVIHKVNSTGAEQWSNSEDNTLDSAGLDDAIALIENDDGSYLYFINGSGEVFSSSDLISSNSFSKIYGANANAEGAIAIDLYQSLYFGDSNNILNKLTKNDLLGRAELDAPVVKALVLDGDQNIYFSAGRFVYSYNDSLTQRWQSEDPISSTDVTSSPVLAAGGSVLYQAGNDALYKFATSDGDEIWSYDLGGNVGDTAPVVDENGNVYLGLSRGGEVVVVSAGGELVDTYSTGKSDGINTPLRLSSTGNLYFGAGDWLFAIKAEAVVDTQSPWPQYKGNVRGTAFVGDSEAVDGSGTYARAELDNDDLTFIEDSNGNAWVVDASDSRAGSSSMRSPELGDSELACISTIAIASGALSFWWKVSSEQAYDVLSLTITSSSGAVNKVASISGSVDWQQIDSEQVSDGDEIKWCYQKDHVSFDGEDAGWLDNVQIN